MPADPAELQRLKDLARAIIQQVEAIEARYKVEPTAVDETGAPLARPTRIR